MTEERRKRACLQLRALLNKGTPRKVAMLTVQEQLRKEGLPSSQPSIYAWCKVHSVSTK